MGAPKIPTAPTPRLDGSSLAAFRCGGCDAPLDWSQPDAREPGRLLGVCGRCGDWHVIDLKPRARVAACLHIPGRRRRRARSVAAIPATAHLGVGLTVPGPA